jgi:hypothetical protein
MTKKKTAAPARAKAKAVEQAAKSRGGVAPRPAPTSMQRDLESARTRSQARRFNKNLTVMGSDVPKNVLKVRATQTGYYDHIRRRPGDVFLIDATPLEADVKVGGKVTRKKGDIAAFSDRWMEVVDPRTPESVSTANDEIRRQHDELLASRHSGGLIPDRPDDVSDDLPDGVDNPLGE